jgi:hypothetical protein
MSTPRWLLMAALMIFVSGHAMACPLCSSILQLTISAQELVYSRHAVLAAPVADRNAYRVVAVIKGEAPAGNTIPGPVFRGLMKSEKPLLLIRDVSWPRWVNFGPVSADQADWLRKLTATKSANDLTDEEWREHVAFFLPYLENPEPMVAEIAFNEFASAPYAALRSLKPRLDAVALRKWLAGSKEMPGRYLGLRIKYLTITREADQHFNTARPVKSIRLRREARPAYRQIASQRTAVTGLIGETSKVKQHSAFNAQGISEGAPISQIIFYLRDHRIGGLHGRTLGQGKATFANCDKFTLA